MGLTAQYTPSFNRHRTKKFIVILCIGFGCVPIRHSLGSFSKEPTSQTLQTRIVGSAVHPGGLPSVCQIQASANDQTFVCSGALISPNEVLTAAHCVEPMDGVAPTFQVDCGSNESYDVKRVSSPKNFDFLQGVPPTSFKRDLAVIRLATHSKITPLPIGNAADLLVPYINGIPGYECQFAGYGVDAEDQIGRLYTAPIPTDTKYKPNLNSIESATYVSFSSLPPAILEKMNALTSANGKISPLNMDLIARIANLSGKVTAHVMHGDSGGPLLCKKSDEKWHVVGVNTQTYAAFGADSSGKTVTILLTDQWNGLIGLRQLRRRLRLPIKGIPHYGE